LGSLSRDDAKGPADHGASADPRLASACKTVPSNNNATGSIRLQIGALHRERMIKWLHGWRSR
jgi:hypothetical protein